MRNEKSTKDEEKSSAEFWAASNISSLQVVIINRQISWKLWLTFLIILSGCFWLVILRQKFGLSWIFLLIWVIKLSRRRSLSTSSQEFTIINSWSVERFLLLWIVGKQIRRIFCVFFFASQRIRTGTWIPFRWSRDY